MKDARYHAIILAGGLGIRLWPWSRRARPKQFLKLDLDGDGTLLQRTWNRLDGLFPADRIWVIAKPEHKDEVLRGLPGLQESRLILEPSPKGTAGAVSLVVARINASHPGAVMGVFPSDHLIEDEDAFRKTMEAGLSWAAEHRDLVLFGIRPDGPETGYGYIEQGDRAGESRGISCFRIRSFHEKPDRRTAEAYLASRDFSWNSGIFAFSSAAYMDAVKKRAPVIWDTLSRLLDPQEETSEAEIYGLFPDDSLDKALIEKTPNLVTIPCDFGWQDMGIWRAWLRALPRDKNGNATDGTVISKGCTRSLLAGREGILVAAVGLEDMVVVAGGDAVLVCPVNRIEEVRDLVEEIRKRGLVGHL